MGNYRQVVVIDIPGRARAWPATPTDDRRHTYIRTHTDSSAFKTAVAWVGYLEEVVFCTGASTAGLFCVVQNQHVSVYLRSRATPRGEEERRHAVKSDVNSVYHTLLPAFAVARASPRGLSKKGASVR